MNFISNSYKLNSNTSFEHQVWSVILQIFESEKVWTSIPIVPFSPCPVWSVTLNKLIVCLLLVSESVLFFNLLEELNLMNLFCFFKVSSSFSLLDFKANLFNISILNFSFFKESLISSKSCVCWSNQTWNTSFCSASFDFFWKMI